MYQKVKFCNLPIDSLQFMWYYKREVRQEELIIKIDEKVIKTNQVFTMTPKEYYEWVDNMPKEKFLPIKIENNFYYLFDEIKIISI